MSKTSETQHAPKDFRSQSKLEIRNNQLKDLNVLHVLVLLPTHVARSSLIIHAGWNEKQTVSLSDV